MCAILSDEVSGTPWCDPRECKLPKCLCPSSEIPKRLTREETPQMVFFTFDDAVNEENIKYYTHLFKTDRLNPNGCPITATFFVSYNWTNFDYVRFLYRNGHEIGSHSITHRLPKTYWARAPYEEWDYEIDGMRRTLAQESRIPKYRISGMRSPFLQVGGNTQFQMLRDNKYVYDSTFVAGPITSNDSDRSTPLWPFTLDTVADTDISSIQPSPNRSFNGFWEVPLNRWIGLDGMGCPMVDACAVPTDEESTYQYLKDNFNRHYERKTPFGINMHAIWFDKGYTYRAMDRFLKELVDMDDVWILTISQIIDWLKHSDPRSPLQNFLPWRRTCLIHDARKSRKLQEENETVKKFADENVTRKSTPKLPAQDESVQQKAESIPRKTLSRSVKRGAKTDITLYKITSNRIGYNNHTLSVNATMVGADDSSKGAKSSSSHALISGSMLTLIHVAFVFGL